MAATLFIISLRTLLLFGFWVLLSAKLDIIHLSIGFICALLIALSSSSTSGKGSASASLFQTFNTAFKALRYSLWLLSRIFLAALHVSKLVVSPKMNLAPAIYTHKTKLKNENARVVFANSITLTPGTITADISGDELTIHQLDKDSSGDITSGEMEKQIQRVFEKDRRK